MISKLKITPAFINASFYYFSSFGIGILRYFFHLILLRFLNPSSYGEFLAYLSLIFLLSVPSSTIGTLVIRRVSRLSKVDYSHTNSFFYKILKIFSLPTIVAAFILVLIAPFLANLFKSQNDAFIILAFFLVISLPSTILRSILTAQEKLSLVSLIGIVEVVFTLVFTFIFLSWKPDPIIPVIVQVTSVIFGCLLMFFLLSKWLWPVNHSSNDSHLNLKGDLVQSFIYSISLASLISSDNLTLRVILDSHTSGFYAALSTIARSFYFALSPLATIVLSVVANRISDHKSPRTVFLKLFFTQAGLSFAGLGLVLFVPSHIIALLGGTTYQSLVALLPIQVAASLFLSLNVFFVSTLMGLHYRHASILILIVALAQPIALTFVRSLSDGVYLNFLVQALGSVLLGFFCISILVQFRPDGTKVKASK